MSDATEKLLLLQVLAQLDEKSGPRRWTGGMVASVMLWISVFCVAMLYFRYGRPTHWTDALLAISCLGVGYYFAYDLYRASYTRQWPVLASYFDRARIEARLRELAPNDSF